MQTIKRQKIYKIRKESTKELKKIEKINRKIELYSPTGSKGKKLGLKLQKHLVYREMLTKIQQYRNSCISSLRGDTKEAEEFNSLDDAKHFFSKLLNNTMKAVEEHNNIAVDTAKTMYSDTVAMLYTVRAFLERNTYKNKDNELLPAMTDMKMGVDTLIRQLHREETMFLKGIAISAKENKGFVSPDQLDALLAINKTVQNQLSTCGMLVDAMSIQKQSGAMLSSGIESGENTSFSEHFKLCLHSLFTSGNIDGATEEKQSIGALASSIKNVDVSMFTNSAPEEIINQINNAFKECDTVEDYVAVLENMATLEADGKPMFTMKDFLIHTLECMKQTIDARRIHTREHIATSLRSHRRVSFLSDTATQFKGTYGSAINGAKEARKRSRKSTQELHTMNMRDIHIDSITKTISTLQSVVNVLETNNAVAMALSTKEPSMDITIRAERESV